MTTSSAPEPQTIAVSTGLDRPQNVMVNVWGVQMVTSEKSVMNESTKKPPLWDPFQTRSSVQKVLGSIMKSVNMVPCHLARSASPPVPGLTSRRLKEKVWKEGLAQPWFSPSTTPAAMVPKAVTSPLSLLLARMLQPRGRSSDQVPRLWSPSGTVVLSVMSALALGAGSEIAGISRMELKPSGWAPIGEATYSTASAARAAMTDDTAHRRPRITIERQLPLEEASRRESYLSRLGC